ncbi:MAG: efflux RND transporter periplasmic adaptor subunit [Cyclobacteriaceae bacterium]
METKNIVAKKYLLPMSLLIVGIVVGWVFNSFTHQPITTSSHQSINTSEVWTCSMHPSVRQPEPGKCPICGMDLIPLGDDGGEDIEGVQMSETAMKLANIQTTVVGKGSSAKELRLTGKVQPDERRIYTQTSHLPGRIEKLAINFTGDYVIKGQTIGQIYSPELVTAQRELLEAYQIREAQPKLFEAAKSKLKNWKLMDDQINAVITNGQPLTNFPLHSDFTGVVLSRAVSLGDHVKQGEPLYEVVDLAAVWVLFDVYESDLAWIKRNDLISFTIQSLPGEEFSGRISFIDPVINPSTRVATVRVEMPNRGMKLKPEMFATGTIESKLSVGSELVLPKSAVLWTGERSIVYVKVADDSGISFQLLEVTLGPSLGEAYIIKDGINIGDEVVTNGTFTIDAAAQLSGKPSMMNTSSKKSENESEQMGSRYESSDKFKKQLVELLDPYLALKDELVETNAKGASGAIDKFMSALQKINMTLVKGEAHTEWMSLMSVLQQTAQQIKATNDVEVQRKSFSDMSNAYYTAINEFNVSELNAYYQFCPMAFNDKGAYWISKDKQISNPYFGDKMLRCGLTKEELK